MPILCPQCKATITPVESSRDDLTTCPHCNTQLELPLTQTTVASTSRMANQKNVRHADPLLAGFLALLFPGLGHYYLGKFDTGFTFQFFLAFPLAVAWFNPGELAIVFLSFAAFVWFLSFLHAIRKASETALPKWWDLRYRVSQIRFSLRSLLITVLIICLPLGWYANERYKCQRLMALVKSGELTDSGYWIKNPWETCLDWIGILRPNITSADFTSRELGRSDLRIISGCRNIKSLSLDSNKNLSDADLTYVSKLSDLRSLYIESDEVTDQGVSEIAKLQHLTSLTLRSPQITDRGLEKLAGHPNLWTLRLSASKATDKGTLKLANIKTLRWLELEDTQISDQGLAALKKLPDLNELEIKKSLITDDGIAHLNGLSKLQGLDLTSHSVTNQGISKLQSDSLKWLRLDCPQLTGEGIRALAKNESVELLTIRNARLSADDVQHLCRLPLESLVLDNSQFESHSIGDLSKFSLLDTLRIRYPKGSGEQVEMLQFPPHLIGLELRGNCFKEDSLKSISSLQTLVGLYLYDMHLSDNTLNSITKLRRLVNLELDGTEVSEQGIPLLAGSKILGRLSLGGSNFNEEHLKQVREIKSLVYLVLRGPKITDKGLAYISGFKGAQVDLTNTQVTRAYAEKWKAMNPRITLSLMPN